jgi:hypothetical protein
MIDEYSEILAALYAAISRVSGARVIVDISKDPTFACLLLRMKRADVRILHLVRDSRAVAYSWTRRRREPSPIEGQRFMGQFRPARTAKSWLTWNTAFHLLSRSRAPYMSLRYERLVCDPRATVAELRAFAGHNLGPDDSELRNSEVKLSGHHMFSGNPMRMSAGWLPLRIDTEWQTQMAPAEVAKVTAITWPLLRAYGYPLRLSARASAGRADAERQS